MYPQSSSLVKTMVICIMILAMATTQDSGPGLDRDELIQALEGLHAGIRDFELVCEGSITAVAPDMTAQARAKRDRAFQANYAYRSVDGAAYLDLMQKPFDSGRPFFRTTQSLLSGKVSEIQRQSDEKGRSGPIGERRGGPAAFRFPCSPERFIFLSKWRGLRDIAAYLEYQCEGWDNIDGNPVLRVSIVFNPKRTTAEKSWSRYWIDLNRGGHVLKEEFYSGSGLLWRVYGIRLARFPLAAGKEAWFPVAAEMDSFGTGNGVQKTPVMHESYRVVQGSLVFNRGLTDERFSVNWNGRKAETPAFTKMARENATKPRPPSPTLRTDPVSVQQYQEEKLAEADRQSRQLDASPPSRRGWSWNDTLPWFVAVSGVSIISVALLLRRRVS